MTRVVPYAEQYRQAWSEYVAQSDSATVAHQIEWREIMQIGLGHQPRYLLGLEGQKLTGLLPLFLVRTWWGKKYLVSLPWIDYGGIIADSQAIAVELLRAATDLAEQEKAEFVELRSVASDNLGLDERTDKVTFRLPLETDHDNLWKGFEAKLRNQIRKADKSGLITEFTSREGLDDFYRVFSRNMRDLGTPVWGRRFFEEILARLSDRAFLILVRKESRVIAGGLVLKFKRSLYVPSASAYRNSLKFCPNHALYWQVIKKGCEDGMTAFDFGRSSRDSNTYRFKKQWVPRPTQLTWQYYLHRCHEMPKINADNPKYRLIINLWRRLPLPVANWLGPKVIRNFP